MIQYFSTSRSHVLTNYQEIISVAKTQNQPVIYGTNDIAPLLAYETKKPLLQGVVDTNPTLFRKGVLNKTQLTKAAIEQKALFVGHGIYYPEYNIRQDLNDEVFDLTQMTKCSLLHSFPAKMEGYENRIILVRCP